MRDLTDKLTARGAEALEDGELLALLLGDGVAGEPMEQLAGRLLDAFGGRLSDLGRADVARLRMAAGIGLKRPAALRPLPRSAGACWRPKPAMRTVSPRATT